MLWYTLLMDDIILQNLANEMVADIDAQIIKDLLEMATPAQAQEFTGTELETLNMRLHMMKQIDDLVNS